MRERPHMLNPAARTTSPPLNAASCARTTTSGASLRVRDSLVQFTKLVWMQACNAYTGWSWPGLTTDSVVQMVSQTIEATL